MDWKGTGYIVSIASVLLLAAAAWPKPEDPSWVLPVLIGGAAASIVGMALRYKAHKEEQQQLKQAAANRGGRER